MSTNTVKKKLMWLADMAGDEVLDAVGLQRRRSAMSVMLPVVGVFGIGMVVGGGLALLFAPKTGTDMRKDIASKANQIKDRIASQATGVMEEVKGALPFGGDKEKSESVRTTHREDNAGIGQQRVMPKPH
jgi:gas vesicle protein